MPKAKRVPVPGQGKGKMLRPFHQFSHLPAELQTRVWELIDPEPRVVELRRHCTQKKKQGNVEQIRCLSGAPAILHVCREARHIALKQNVYQRAFIRGESYTWVNFEVDLISVGPLDTEWLEAEKTLIQRFRFESENNESFYHFQSARLRTFTSLKELQILCMDGIGLWVQVAEEIEFPTENVLFISSRAEKPKTYTRADLFEMVPSRPFAEYSSSSFRQTYDKRIKGSEDEAPEELLHEFYGC